MFGYDGNVFNPSEQDKQGYCYETTCMGETFWVPKELIGMGMELEQMFKTYPRYYNVSFKVYGGRKSFIATIFEKIKKQTAPLVENQLMLKNKVPQSSELRELIEIPRNFNEPFQDEEKKLIGISDYEEYTKNQEDFYQKTHHLVLVNKENVREIANIVKRYLYNINIAICHGSRRGYEQKWFSEFLETKVVGTDISEDASRYEDNMCHDFHDLLYEWIQRVDFIYSNSLNHSYNPIYCIDQWMISLRLGGICVIEWTPQHNINQVDQYRPFGSTLEGLVSMIKDKYLVKNVLKLTPQPITDTNLNPLTPPIERYAIIIQADERIVNRIMEKHS
jgi:hypothetical protein